jgi:hypothetical protein
MFSINGMVFAGDYRPEGWDGLLKEPTEVKKTSAEEQTTQTNVESTINNCHAIMN